MTKKRFAYFRFEWCVKVSLPRKTSIHLKLPFIKIAIYLHELFLDVSIITINTMQTNLHVLSEKIQKRDATKLRTAETCFP